MPVSLPSTVFGCKRTKNNAHHVSIANTVLQILVSSGPSLSSVNTCAWQSSIHGWSGYLPSLYLNWPPDAKRWHQKKEKNPDAGKDWRQKETKEFLDSITNSTDMNLNKLQEIVEDRGAWCATVHGIAKSWTWLSSWMTTTAFTMIMPGNLTLSINLLFTFSYFFSLWASDLSSPP